MILFFPGVRKSCAGWVSNALVLKYSLDVVQLLSSFCGSVFVAFIYTRCSQIFLKCGNHLQILGTRRVT